MADAALLPDPDQTALITPPRAADTSHAAPRGMEPWDGTRQRTWGDLLTERAAPVPPPSETPVPQDPLAISTAEPVSNVGGHFGEAFDAASRQGEHDGGAVQHGLALSDAYDQRNAAIKSAMNVDVPNPMQDGFYDEAVDAVRAQNKAQGPATPGMFSPNIEDPEKFSDDVQKMQVTLWQNRINELAKQASNKATSPETADQAQTALAALKPNVPIIQDVAAMMGAEDVRSQQAQAAMGNGLMAKTAGFLGGLWAGRRDPLNWALTAIPFGEAAIPAKLGLTGAPKVLVGAAEQGVKTAAANMGLTAIEAPGQQEWNQQIGREHGFLPAIKDIADSGVGGLLFGAGMHIAPHVLGEIFDNIKKIGSVFGNGPDSAQVIDDFIRMAKGGQPGPTTAAAKAFLEGPGKPAPSAGGTGPTPESGGPAPTSPGGAPAPIDEKFYRDPWPQLEGPKKPFTAPVDPQPRQTAITPARIAAAEANAALAPPLVRGFSPDHVIDAYGQAISHGENPDIVHPPVPPAHAPVAPASSIPPDHTAALAPTHETGDMEMGKPVKTNVTFDPRALATDPATFQTAARNPIQGPYDPARAGTLVVYQDKAGRETIVDGAARQALAKQSGYVDPSGQPIKMQGTLLRETDGWTPEEARAIGAKKNMQEGSLSTMQAAQALRDHPGNWDDSLPRTKTLTDAKGLANLSDPAWQMMRDGVVKQAHASLIGQIVPDSTLHSGIAAALHDAQPKTTGDAIKLIHDLNASNFKREIQASAFGGEKVTEALLPHRVTVVDAIQKMIAKPDSKMFPALDRAAMALEARTGASLPPATTQVARAAQIADTLSALARHDPMVSAALNHAANAVANGNPAAFAAKTFLSRVQKMLDDRDVELKLDPDLPEPTPGGLDLDDPKDVEAYTKGIEAENGAFQKEEIGAPWEIEHDIVPKLTDAGLPEEMARAIAAEMTARYEARAVMMGRSPDAAAALYHQDGWRVTGEVEAPPAAPPVPTSEPPVTEGRPRLQSLRNYLLGKTRVMTRRGNQMVWGWQTKWGLKPVGELEGRLPKYMIRSTGLDLDTARRYAAEQGYFHEKWADPNDAMEQSGIDDLLDKLLDDKPHYTGADQEWLAKNADNKAYAEHLAEYEDAEARRKEMLAPYEQAIDRHLETHGLSLTDREREFAANLLESGTESHADNAVERAALLHGVDEYREPPETMADFFARHADEEEPLSFFQPPRTVPTFYSAVARTVDMAKMAKATPEQWLATIKNAAGVRPEEMKWLGLEDFLKEQKGPVTREAVADFIRANEIKVDEVMHGAYPKTELADAAREMFGKELHELTRREDQILGAARNAEREMQADFEPKFGQYTLPGGKPGSYRELLLTLPEKDTITKTPVQVPQGWGDTEGGNVGIETHGDTGADFRHSHWSEPNVLAHVRFDEREVEGQRAMHLAEIQSDWHQLGRRKGYFDPARKQRLIELGAQIDKIRPSVSEMLRRNDQLGFDRMASALAAIVNDRPDHWEFERPEDLALAEQFHEMRREENRLQMPDQRPPDAPFKTTWGELALKRAIRYAVDGGFDRLTWDTGATAADRFDLSKQVRRIDYHPTTHELAAWGIHQPEGVGPQILRTVAPEGLSDEIGKDATEKLLATEVNEQGRHSLTGDGLKVGSAGMRGFYDKILPAAVNKLVKKFGAKVSEAEIVKPGGIGAWTYTGPELTAPALLSRITAASNAAIDSQLRAIAKLVEDGVPFAQAMEDEGSYGAAEAIGGKLEARATSVPVHSLTLTPELKAAAQSEGFPLFQPGGAGPRAQIQIRQNERIVSLFAKGDVSSAIHEMGHAFLEDLTRDATGPNATPQLRSDMQTVMDWLGVERPEDIGEPEHEKFAAGWERYHAEGVAPSARLAKVFEKFKQWMMQIYRRLDNVGVPISDAIRAVFDRMLATEEEIAAKRMAEPPEPAAATVERTPAMDVAGVKEPAENVAVEAPSGGAVAAAERGAGPAPAGAEQPRSGLSPAEILALPEVRQAIEAPRAINRDHSIPYLAGSSTAGDVTYIDKEIPPLVKIGNKQVDVAKYLNVHEQVEHALMVVGRMPYLAAHRIATEHEIAAVEADGVNVKAYNRFMDAHVADTEKELGKSVDAPADLYEKPYPHSEQHFLDHEAAGDTQIMGATREPAEALVRGAVARAKDAALASPDPLDQALGAAMQQHAEPLLDAAFPKEPVASPAERFAKMQEEHRRVEALVRNAIARPIPKLTLVKGDNRLVLSKGLGEYPLRMTSIDKDGPIGHRDYGQAENDVRGMTQEVAGAMREGYKVTGGMETVAPKIAAADHEIGADGKPQVLIPGVKAVTDADRLRLAAAKPMRGGNAPAGGMFDHDALAQTDMFDLTPTDEGLKTREQVQTEPTLAEVISAITTSCRVR